MKEGEGGREGRREEGKKGRREGGREGGREGEREGGRERGREGGMSCVYIIFFSSQCVSRVLTDLDVVNRDPPSLPGSLVVDLKVATVQTLASDIYNVTWKPWKQCNHGNTVDPYIITMEQKTRSQFQVFTSY